MPNSFLGFPVRRAMLADYALKSATLSDLYAAPGYFFNFYFNSLDGLYVSSSPADGVVLTETQVALSTQGGGTDFASITKTPANFTALWDWTTEAKFRTEVLFAATSDSLPIFDVQWGDVDAGRHFGFTVRAGVLSATVGNGSAEVLSAAIENWGAAGYYEIRKLEARYAATGVQFYVNDVLVATITTGLPAGNASARRCVRLYVRANASTNIHGITLSYWVAWKAP